jgi:hypothetical protein
MVSRFVQLLIAVPAMNEATKKKQAQKISIACPVRTTLAGGTIAL